MTSSAVRERRAGTPVGMEPFLVLFDAWRGAGDSRLEQTMSQVALAEENRHKLMDFIKKQGLADKVASVAPGTTLGAIGVVMTPDAARRIEALDGVTRVMRAR